VLSDLSSVAFVPPDAACSAVAVTRSASHNGAPILAHNFDYFPLLQPHYLIRRSAPAGGLRSVELSVSLAPGAVSGINEAGLSITCNYAHATDKSSPAPTITMLIAEALAACRTVGDAVQFFQQTPRTGGGLLMLGDPSGEIAAVEISNRQVVRRDPQHDRLAHSNRYCSATMRQLEVHEEAMYGKNHFLSGRRVHQSSEERDAALSRRLSETTAFDPDAIQRVMSDHGPEGKASADTVCMHGEYWHTTASLQVLPSERVLRASFSPTCIAQYEEFSV
jgi:predicted choloylglycine hydrolase